MDMRSAELVASELVRDRVAQAVRRQVINDLRGRQGLARGGRMARVLGRLRQQPGGRLQPAAC